MSSGLTGALPRPVFLCVPWKIGDYELRSSQLFFPSQVSVVERQT